MKHPTIKDLLNDITDSNQSFLNRDNNIKNKFHDHSSSIIVSIKTGGSNGGYHDCSASDYYIVQDERNEELVDSLGYLIAQNLPFPLSRKELDTAIYQYMQIHNADVIDDYSENSDYYGNATKYNICSINLSDLMYLILPKKMHLEFDTLFSNHIVEVKNSILKNKNEYELIQINNTIEKFRTNKIQDEVDLKSKLAYLKTQLISLENKISSFEKDKDLELNKLLKRQKKLQKEVGVKIIERENPKYKK